MTAAFLRAHRRTWSSLRNHRNYRIFFAGQVVSVTGTWMQNVAAAWLVLTLTHSPVAVGVLMLCQFLPATALGLVGGVIVDRLDVRRVVIVTQAASMVFAGVLAALTLGGIVEVWQVYLLTGLRGISLVFDHPARQQLTFQMVGRDELPNAVALNSGPVQRHPRHRARPRRGRDRNRWGRRVLPPECGELRRGARQPGAHPPARAVPARPRRRPADADPRQPRSLRVSPRGAGGRHRPGPRPLRDHAVVQLQRPAPGPRGEDARFEGPRSSASSLPSSEPVR